MWAVHPGEPYLRPQQIAAFGQVSPLEGGLVNPRGRGRGRGRWRGRGRGGPAPHRCHHCRCLVPAFTSGGSGGVRMLPFDFVRSVFPYPSAENLLL